MVIKNDEPVNIFVSSFQL